MLFHSFLIYSFIPFVFQVLLLVRLRLLNRPVRGCCLVCGGGGGIPGYAVATKVSIRNAATSGDEDIVSAAQSAMPWRPGCDQKLERRPLALQCMGGTTSRAAPPAVSGESAAAIAARRAYHDTAVTTAPARCGKARR